MLEMEMLLPELISYI